MVYVGHDLIVAKNIKSKPKGTATRTLHSQTFLENENLIDIDPVFKDHSHNNVDETMVEMDENDVIEEEEEEISKVEMKLDSDLDF